MAYDDSGELSTEQGQYNLGGYSFELEIQNVHEPGEPDVVSVFARCYGPDGTRETQAKDFPEGTTVEGWYVEANETEASVYATIQTSGNNPWDMPEFAPAVVSQIPYVPDGHWTLNYSIPVHAVKNSSHRYGTVAASSEFTYDNSQGSTYQSQSWTYNGKTVYYDILSDNGCSDVPDYSDELTHFSTYQIAWQMIYGSFDDEEKDVLVGRFAIDLREADGGPDGDWDEPGDDGNSSYTLNVTVTGASAGTHNGGVPSTPSDAQVYGCGGTGGNGGGGGAGASTVIIYEFATSRAGSVNQTAASRGAGSGGPGGRGGKGADGCILVFY